MLLQSGKVVRNGNLCSFPLPDLQSVAISHSILLMPSLINLDRVIGSNDDQGESFEFLLALTPKHHMRILPTALISWPGRKTEWCILCISTIYNLRLQQEYLIMPWAPVITNACCMGPDTERIHVNLSGWKYCSFHFSESWKVIAQPPSPLPPTARVTSHMSSAQQYLTGGSQEKIRKPMITMFTLNSGI